MDSAVSRNFDALRSDALWREIEQFWQLPIIMTTSWLNALTDAMWPQREECPFRTGDHEQMVVPEPFENDGEPGLFA